LADIPIWYIRHFKFKTVKKYLCSQGSRIVTVADWGHHFLLKYFSIISEPMIN